MEKYKVPDIKLINDLSKPWATTEIERKDHQSQSSDPIDAGLLEKIGLKKDQKILFVAGYWGQWARAISRGGCDVTYSDITDDFCKEIKSVLEKDGITKVIFGNGADFPKEKYDWTVTFEPADENKWLFITIFRSLLFNEFGIKVINFHLERKEDRVRSLFRLMQELYGANFQEEHTVLTCRRRNGNVEECLHTIFTLTKDGAQLDDVKKDLAIIENIESVDKVKDKEPLERINRISDLLSDKILISI